MVKRSGSMGEVEEPEQAVDSPEQVDESISEEENAGIGEDERADTEEASEEEGGTSVSLEDLDPESPLWEGGPLVKSVSAWKAKHGEVYITYFTPSVRVIWRPLSRADYRQIVSRMAEISAERELSNAEATLLNEELTAQTVILWPEYNPDDADHNLGGLASTITNQSMEASGFSAMDVRQL